MVFTFCIILFIRAGRMVKIALLAASFVFLMSSCSESTPLTIDTNPPPTFRQHGPDHVMREEDVPDGHITHVRKCEPDGHDIAPTQEELEERFSKGYMVSKTFRKKRK